MFKLLCGGALLPPCVLLGISQKITQQAGHAFAFEVGVGDSAQQLLDVPSA